MLRHRTDVPGHGRQRNQEQNRQSPMEHQSVWDILNGAWGTLWIIAAFSVLSLTVALERGWALWQFTSRARALADTVSRCLTRGAVDEGRSACERSRSPLAEVFLVGYERIGRVKPENVDAAVHRERARVAASLKVRLWIVGTIGAAAPFVGLFGTVVGIMNAFARLQEAEVAGEGTGIGVVSGNISEALIATAAGIGVAVVAVIIYNFFNQRLARIAQELKMLTDEFLEQLHEHGPESEQAPRSRTREDADGDRKAA
jgi:biopolymer transport protein ExbB